MEHWLWEESTMKGLLMASGVDTDEEMLKVLYQQASRHKAADLAHQAFYGATEWELFSTYSIDSGEETVMAVAQRLAEEYIPHNVPHSTDFSALFNIAQDNIHGESVALYRYLWAEAVSAHVFEKTKAAYQSPEGIPKEALLQQLCQPGSWAELANAFDLPPDKIDMDPVWKRYRLE
jgi:Zn-dependent oligopeptidase